MNHPGRLNVAPVLWALVYAMALVLIVAHVLMIVGALS